MLTKRHGPATYTLIYAFLKKQSHTKTAEAVKKAAKDVVDLDDVMDVDHTSLDEIVRQWKSQNATRL